MFPSADDPGFTPKDWRTRLHRAAGLFIAFVTLDGYGPFASAFDDTDELSGDLLHPHARDRHPLQTQSRRRGHGVPPAVPGVCICAPATRRPSKATLQHAA